MSAVDDHLQQLRRALRTRGAARRRILHECQDHLADLAAQHGPAEAARRFGDPVVVAAAFDAETAVRAALRSTLATCAGIVAVAASTVALLHAASDDARASVWWAVVFFAAAQTSAVSTVLALLQAAVVRRGEARAADVALLCRRNGSALLAAALTMFAAGAGVPGHGSAAALLAGPVVAAFAGVAVLRARRLLRGPDVRASRAGRPPLGDVAALLRLRVRPPGTGVLLAFCTSTAVLAALGWAHGEDATAAGAVADAGIEGLLVLALFVVLGPALGLTSRRRRPARSDGRDHRDGRGHRGGA